jgi:hypothetical protein
MNDYPTTPGPDHDDERIRRLLDEAVSDVEPREALDAIHARTKVSSMQSKRSWLLGAGAAVVATAATVVAVTVLSDSPTGNGEDAAPATSASPKPDKSPSDTESSPSPTQEAAQQAVPVYYVGDTTRGPRLYREFHRLATSDPLTSALEEAVSTTPDDPDYRTPWPAGTTVDGGFDGVGSAGEITIRLSNDSGLRQRPAGMSGDEARMAVEQLIYTAQAATQTRAPVQFLIDGQRTDMVLGQPSSEPLAQGDAIDVLAQVWITEPGESAEVSTPFKVSGLAAAFEATVLWELRAGDKVVADGFTTAEECCTMAPYTFTVKNVSPGDYTLVVTDNDPSGGEGLGVWEDTKQVTVLP